MKKRTVKDFIALYAPEDEEKLVLIQDGMGIVSVVGSILNWNWMCDPTGKPDSHRYGRGSRRVIFFLLGIVLIVTSIMSWVL